MFACAFVHAFGLFHIASQLTAGGIDVIATGLRTVVTYPAALSCAANAATVARSEQVNPESGKGLKGMRLILQDTPVPACSRNN